MSPITIRHIFLAVFVYCLFTLFPRMAYGENTKTTFRITVLKSDGQPQPGMVLKILGRNEEYTGDAQGVITFTYAIDKRRKRTAELYFPSDRQKAAASFPLTEENTSKTFYLDSPQELALLRQSRKTFPIEGFVTTDSGIPIEGAVVSIQGTGRRTTSDEIGLFRIDADFSHPVSFRANGMENRSLPVQVFLQNSNEPYTVVLNRKNASQIYASTEQMPEYPGGMKAFMRYLKRNLKYPEHALRDSIEGVVVVQFIVEKTGQITSPTVVRGLRPDMDTAALHLITKMPRWIPAKDHGITVRCKYSMPVQFKIERPKPVEPKTGTMVTDSILIGKDSLCFDSLTRVPILPDTARMDSLPLRNDSLLLLPDSLHMPEGLLPVEMEGDSLFVPADTVLSESLPVQKPADAVAEKPKKRNIFVRFFRWLFGKKG